MKGVTWVKKDFALLFFKFVILLKLRKFLNEAKISIYFNISVLSSNYYLLPSDDLLVVARVPFTYVTTIPIYINFNYFPIWNIFNIFLNNKYLCIDVSSYFIGALEKRKTQRK